MNNDPSLTPNEVVPEAVNLTPNVVADPVLKPLKASFIAKLKTKFANAKTAKYLKIGGIVIVVIALGLIAKNLLKGDETPKYSLLYVSKDNDLMMVNANTDKTEKITGDATDTEAIYANQSNRYILYTKEYKLYLLDTKKPEEPTKIAKDVNSFAFSENDKYVYYTNDESDLYIYDMKDSEKIESNVDSVIGTTKDKILYEKSNKLYVRSLKLSKDDETKIDSDIYYSYFTEDKKAVVYYNEDSDLYLYNIGKAKSEKLASDVSEVVQANEDYSKFFYLDDEDLKYYKNGKTIKIADEVGTVYFADVDTMQVLYTEEDDSYINYETDDDYDDYGSGDYNYDDYDYDYGSGDYNYDDYDYDYDDYGSGDYNYDDYDYDYDEYYGVVESYLYYQKGEKDRVTVKKNIALTDAIIDDGKAIYYIENDDDQNKLYYAKISGSKVKDPEKVSSKLYSSDFTVGYDKGLLVFTGDEEKANLQLIKKDKLVEIAKDVLESNVQINNNQNKLYFLTDYDYEDGEGKFQVYNGSKLKEISKDVYSARYIRDDLIYIFKDYNDDEVTMYRYNGKKEEKIADEVIDVMPIYNSANSYYGYDY